MESRWRIELFGGLSARQGEHVLTRFDSRKTAALLACLALDLGRPWSREALTEQLWPGEEPEATRSRLRQALAVLRRALEPPGAEPESVLLASRRPEVQLCPTAVTTDVAEFEEALRAAASTSESGAQIASLARAAELYRGELLPGYFEEAIVSARVRLAEAHLDALHALVAALERTGEGSDALAYARRAVAADPLHEEAQCDLIRVYAKLGQTSAATRQYRDFERLLEEELDTVPSAATRALAEQVAAGSIEPVLRPPPQESMPAGTASRSDETAAPMPVGTVTFLLTDIEGSTRLWEQDREGMGTALARHDEIAADVVARFHGALLKRRGEGDSLFVVFSRARDAVAAACAMQRELRAADWPPGIVLHVRMALHTGEAEQRDGDYYGPDVNRCARLRATAGGGQILLSQAVRDLAGDVLPAGTSLRDLGERPLRDLERPEHVYELIRSELAGVTSSPRRPRIEQRGATHQSRGVLGSRRRALLSRRLVVLGCLLLALALGLTLRPRWESRRLYRLGRDAWNERTERSLERGRRYFEQAAALDPTFAPAFTGVAESYLLLGYYGHLHPKTAAQGAAGAIRQAMACDPQNAGAYTARAMAEMIFDWNWDAAEVDFTRALERDPGYATAHQWYSLLLIVKGLPEESLEAIGRAGGLDISSRVISKSVGGRYYFLGQYDRAIERCNATIELDPNYSLAHYWLGLALTQKRQYEAARKAIKDAYWLSSDAADFEAAYQGFRGSTAMLASLAYLDAVSGQKGEAREILERLRTQRENGRRYVSPVCLATAYMGLGQRSQTLQWLATALRERACEMIFLHVDPVFAPLVADPRFVHLLKQVGLRPVPRLKAS